MKYPHIIVALCCFLSLSLTSCFKDTDWSQGDDVVLNPVVDLNLIYFTIDASQFYDDTTNTEHLTVRDTTALELLEGSDIRDILIGADFLFKFTNSIDKDFAVNFDFLTEDNEISYSTGTSVDAGTIATPVETVYIDNLDNDEIDEVTFSTKVAITVTIPSADASLTGNLNLQSKTTYFLEID